jgi:hypothetical protein
MLDNAGQRRIESDGCHMTHGYNFSSDHVLHGGSQMMLDHDHVQRLAAREASRQHIIQFVTKYVDDWIRRVRTEGQSPPPWDSSAIAAGASEQVLKRFQDEVEAGILEPGAAENRATRAANRLMADDLNWDVISTSVTHFLNRHKGNYGLQDADVHDFTQIAASITLVRWDPNRELHWNEPGSAYAVRVAWNLIRHVPDQPPPAIDAFLDLRQAPVQDPVDALISRESMERLVLDFNNWLETQPHKLQAAFLSSFVDGMPGYRIGMLLSDRQRDTEEAYRHYFYRVFNHLVEDLRKFLQGRGW